MCIHTISFSNLKMPTAQHAILPSFPTLIHEATQIFSSNPPFAHAPIPPEFGNTIWRDDWILNQSNITRSLVSCVSGSNKMSCLPFGLLMPLWASFCRSLMCHGDITALDSNLLVDLEITGWQQVSPLSPVHPRWGETQAWNDIEMSSSVSVSLFLSSSVHKCSQLLAPPCR